MAPAWHEWQDGGGRPCVRACVCATSLTVVPWAAAYSYSSVLPLSRLLSPTKEQLAAPSHHNSSQDLTEILRKTEDEEGTCTIFTTWEAKGERAQQEPCFSFPCPFDNELAAFYFSFSSLLFFSTSATPRKQGWGGGGGVGKKIKTSHLQLAPHDWWKEVKHHSWSCQWEVIVGKNL